MTDDEDQRGSVSSTIVLVRIRVRFIERRKLVALFRRAWAINSLVIDGAISGAMRGRILAACRCTES